MINDLPLSDKVTILNSEDTAIVVCFDLNKASASEEEEEEEEDDVSNEDAAGGAGDEGAEAKSE